MRIGVISDLHVDLNAATPGDQRVLTGLLRVLKSRSLELLVVAGDVAPSLSEESIPRPVDAEAAQPSASPSDPYGRKSQPDGD